jgi:hypothetical protein
MAALNTISTREPIKSNYWYLPLLLILYAALRITEALSVMFVVQPPVHTDVRVTTTRLGRRILRVGFVRDHLHLVSRTSCDGSLVCVNATAVFEVDLYATSLITVSTGDKKKGRVPYVFVDSETWSARERCIRVAAIDIIISAGTWNICIAEMH